MCDKTLKYNLFLEGKKLNYLKKKWDKSKMFLAISKKKLLELLRFSNGNTWKDGINKDCKLKGLN